VKTTGATATGPGIAAAALVAVTALFMFM